MYSRNCAASRSSCAWQKQSSATGRGLLTVKERLHHKRHADKIKPYGWRAKGLRTQGGIQDEQYSTMR